MPSPVSPDAGFPEHQPDRRRRQDRPRTEGRHQDPDGSPPSGGRPRSGQFPVGPPSSRRFPPNRPASAPVPGQAAGGLTSGQVPSAAFPSRQSGAPQPGTPQSGPVAAAPSGTVDDPGEHTGGRGERTGRGGGGERGSRNTARDWIWSVVAFVVAAVVIGAVGFHFFGPDDAPESTAAWAVDSCAGPDPTSGEDDAYRPLACDDPQATVTILDIQDAVSTAQAHCPGGTDVVFQKDGQAGGETQSVCARNLSDDHPGDPGRGGGQLVVGDCVDGDGAEVPCGEGGRTVTGLLMGGAECPDGTADELELGFDPYRSYETICLAA